MQNETKLIYNSGRLWRICIKNEHLHWSWTFKPTNLTCILCHTVLQGLSISQTNTNRNIEIRSVDAMRQYTLRAIQTIGEILSIRYTIFGVDTLNNDNIMATHIIAQLSIYKLDAHMSVHQCCIIVVYENPVSNLVVLIIDPKWTVDFLIPFGHFNASCVYEMFTC